MDIADQIVSSGFSPTELRNKAKGQLNIWLSGKGIAGEFRLITNALVNY